MTILQQLKDAVAIVYADAPVVGALCIAQGCLESNLLGQPSGLAAKYNNLFGIKKAGTTGLVVLSTFEYIRGSKVEVRSSFGSNKTIQDSVQQHRAVMELHRYQNVWKAESLAQAAYAVLAGGYATDPAYATKLIAIDNELKS